MFKTHRLRDFFKIPGKTPRIAGQLRLYKRRPNPFQLEKGAVEVKEDEVKTPRFCDMILSLEVERPMRVIATPFGQLVACVCKVYYIYFGAGPKTVFTFN